MLHEAGLRILHNNAASLPLPSLIPGKGGSMKQVWELGGTTIYAQDVILKTELYVDAGQKWMQHEIMDANIMTAATSRPHIMNIYGCRPA
ncbi:MAG: hypothetical protein SGARI_000286 [Bacillariaceae sp.]